MGWKHRESLLEEWEPKLGPEGQTRGGEHAETNWRSGSPQFAAPCL